MKSWIKPVALCGLAAVIAGGTFAVSSANEKKPATLNSGVSKGEMLPAFHPTHVAGPDKNTDTCPVCKYGMNPAVQVWVNSDDAGNVTEIVKTLDKEVATNKKKKLRAFVVYINPKSETKEEVEKNLAKLNADAKSSGVGIAYLDSPKNDAVKGYAINTDAKVKNTIFVYKNLTVATKFVNLKADKTGLASLKAAIAKVL